MRGDSSRRAAALAGALLGTVALVAVPVSPAQAAEELKVQVYTDGVRQPAGKPVFSRGNLLPGETLERSVRLTNTGDDRARLTMALTDLSNDDGGCTESEREVGDVSCGEGEGELQRLAVLTVTADGVERYVGPLTGADYVVLANQLVAPDASVDVDVTLSLPWSATDLVQSDEVGFTMGWVLGTSSIEVPGVEHGPDEPRDRGLAHTGFVLAPLVLGAALLIVGMIARRLGSARAGRPSEPSDDAQG